MPKYSVIIPILNEDPRISPAISSVKSIDPSAEVIVVDGILFAPHDYMNDFYRQKELAQSRVRIAVC